MDKKTYYWLKNEEKTQKFERSELFVIANNFVV